LTDGQSDDVSGAGTGAYTANQHFTGTYSVGSNGRGTALLAIPGLPLGNFVFYVVSAHELLFLDEEL
jgi:hypothetical protein